jgi:hypothetical protein
MDEIVVNLMPRLLLYPWQNTNTPPPPKVATEWKLVWNQMPTLQNENTGVAWISFYVYGGGDTITAPNLFINIVNEVGTNEIHVGQVVQLV